MSTLTVEQLTHLITILYTSPTPSETREADSQLKAWQASSSAWDSALSGLASVQSDTARYFFANTIRSKIQLDFFQIPNSAAALALKQRLLSETFTKPLPSATLTQLLLSLADLAIQLDDLWPNPLIDLITASTTFTTTSTTTFTTTSTTGTTTSTTIGNQVILEVIKLMAEELDNERLVVEENKRDSCRKRLSQQFLDVHQFLCSFLSSPSGSLTPHGASGQANDGSAKMILKCLLPWLKLSVPSEEILISSPLMAKTLSCLPGEAALDIVLELLQAQTQQPSLYPRLVREAVLPALLRLELPLGDVEELAKVARVLTLCASSLIEDQASTASAGQGLSSGLSAMLNKLTYIVGHRSEGEAGLEASMAVLELFQDVAMEWRAEEAVGSAGILANLLDALIRRLTVAYQVEAEVADDSEEAGLEATIRSQTLATARAVVKALGVEVAGGKLLEAFGSAFAQVLAGVGAGGGGAAVYVSSAIGAVLVEAIDGGFRISSEVALQEVVGVLVRVVGGGVAGSRLRITCIRLLASLADELDRVPGLLESVLSALSSLCLSGVSRSSSEELETALALKAVVRRHRKPEFIPGLTAVLKTQKLHSGAAQTAVVEAVVVLLNEVTDDDVFCRGLGEALEPLVVAIASGNVAPGAASKTTDLLDQVTTICRSLRLTTRGGDPQSRRVAFFASSVAPVLWQSLAVCLTSGRVAKDEATVEKSCRVIKHLIRVDLAALEFLVPKIATKVMSEFRANPGVSSYLYVAEILADAYGSATTPGPATPVLAELFDAMAEVGLTAVVAADEEGAQELLAEDLFGMASRFLKRAGQVLRQSRFFRPLLETAVRIMPGVRRRETFDGVTGFIENVLTAVPTGGAGGLDVAVAQATLAAVVRVVREGAGEDLLVMLPTLIVAVRKSLDAGGAFRAADLLGEALERELPEGVLASAREKDDVVKELLGEGQGRVVRRLVELGKRANQRLRRR